jgi:RNA polymerase sigma factor (sigma-70 family)
MGRTNWPLTLAFVMVGDREAAEEIAQEAFARVYRARGRVLEPMPYVRSVVYNLSRNHRRDRSRRRLGSLRLELRVDYSTNDYMVDAVRALPMKYRSLVVLRYYEYLSDAEIAATTSLPIGTVKSRLHRALRMLRRSLHE